MNPLIILQCILYKNNISIDLWNIFRDYYSKQKITQDDIKTAVTKWIEYNKYAKLKYGHISYWDVSNCIDMSYLFYMDENNNFYIGKNFNDDISLWDVSNVKNMTCMFAYCDKFNQNISSWNTSKVISMSCMFLYASSFNHSIECWNMTNVTDKSYMFNQATSYNKNKKLINFLINLF